MMILKKVRNDTSLDEIDQKMVIASERVRTRLEVPSNLLTNLDNFTSRKFDPNAFTLNKVTVAELATSLGKVELINSDAPQLLNPPFQVRTNKAEQRFGNKSAYGSMARGLGLQGRQRRLANANNIDEKRHSPDKAASTSTLHLMQKQKSTQLKYLIKNKCYFTNPNTTNTSPDRLKMA